MTRETNSFALGVLWAILTIQWPDGTTEQVPATTLDACQAAQAALTTRLWTPVGKTVRPRSVWCQNLPASQSGFAPGWDCIQGFNCPK